MTTDIRRKRMDFKELMLKRYSVRAYKDQPVEAEKLAQVLEAARMAPTAANRQPFQIVVIDTAGREEELKRIYRHEWFVQAPLVLCVCATPDSGWVRKKDNNNYTDVDAAIVMDHMILAATDLGLGTCWIAAFDPDAAREVLGLPEDVYPVVFTPLGYPADSVGRKTRKPLEELVRYDHW
jgi:nitroreductase